VAEDGRVAVGVLVPGDARAETRKAYHKKSGMGKGKLFEQREEAFALEFNLPSYGKQDQAFALCLSNACKLFCTYAQQVIDTQL
jgi:hypothetical protein